MMQITWATISPLTRAVPGATDSIDLRAHGDTLPASFEFLNADEENEEVVTDTTRDGVGSMVGLGRTPSVPLDGKYFPFSLSRSAKRDFFNSFGFDSSMAQQRAKRGGDAVHESSSLSGLKSDADLTDYSDDDECLKAISLSGADVGVEVDTARKVDTTSMIGDNDLINCSGVEVPHRAPTTNKLGDDDLIDYSDDETTSDLYYDSLSKRLNDDEAGTTVPGHPLDRGTGLQESVPPRPSLVASDSQLSISRGKPMDEQQGRLCPNQPSNDMRLCGTLSTNLHFPALSRSSPIISYNTRANISGYQDNIDDAINPDAGFGQPGENTPSQEADGDDLNLEAAQYSVDDAYNYLAADVMASAADATSRDRISPDAANHATEAQEATSIQTSSTSTVNGDEIDYDDDAGNAPVTSGTGLESATDEIGWEIEENEQESMEPHGDDSSMRSASARGIVKLTIRRLWSMKVVCYNFPDTLIEVRLISMEQTTSVVVLESPESPTSSANFPFPPLS